MQVLNIRTLAIGIVVLWLVCMIALYMYYPMNGVNDNDTSRSEREQRYISPSPPSSIEEEEETPSSSLPSIQPEVPPSPVIETKPVLDENQILSILNEPIEQKLARIKTKNNEIIITTATFPFKEFLYNWLCSVKPLGDLSHVLIYTVDQSLARELIVEHNFHNVYWEKSRGWEKGEAVDYGSYEYRMLMLYRTEFIRHVLVELNYKILLADNDAVWLHQSPLKYINENVKDKDLAAQDDSMGAREGRNGMVCGGFIYLNTTQTMKNVWSDLTNSYSNNVRNGGDPGNTEQIMITNMMSRFNYQLLPWWLFPSGHNYFGERNKEEVFKDVIVVHNNWVIGKAKKEQRFREVPGLWLLDDDGKCKN
jgi:hypothetical protein